MIKALLSKTRELFFLGASLVKAATGVDISAQDLGGAFVHTQKSGVADHLAEDDEHALYLLREVVAHLGKAKKPFNRN